MVGLGPGRRRGEGGRFNATLGADGVLNAFITDARDDGSVPPDGAHVLSGVFNKTNYAPVMILQRTFLD